MMQATPKQVATAEHVEGEILVLLNEWLQEGADPQDLLAAVGKAAEDLLVQVYGAEHVAAWFIGMAVNFSNVRKGN